MTATLCFTAAPPSSEMKSGIENAAPPRGTRSDAARDQEPKKLGRRLGDLRQHVHAATRAFVPRERHHAVDEREQRVVLAEADVAAGKELGAALAHEDVAGEHELTAEPLDAQALG